MSYNFLIMKDLNNWVTGWIDWNLALDEKGGPNWVENYVDAAVIVNATANEFYKQPMFYTLAHFAKFIRPGSEILEYNVTKPDEDSENAIKLLMVQRPENSNGYGAVVLNKWAIYFAGNL